jgi:hypothetical protein
MREQQIKKIVKEKLESDGWLCWYPAQTRFAPKFNYCDKQHSAKDMFSIFDLVCAKEGVQKWIQYTSKGNIRAREKKIKNFCEKWNLKFEHAEVWGVDSKDDIKIIKI